MHKWSFVLSLFMACSAGLLYAAEPEKQGLFRVERSKNANIVQYDAQISPDGKLYRDEPVVAYWIRMAEEGQVEKLSWIQWVFAFGFDTVMGTDGESAEMLMRGGKDRAIKVIREGDRYCGVVPIDGAPSCIEKIYVNANRKGLNANVKYFELWGFELGSGTPRYEKVLP